MTASGVAKSAAPRTAIAEYLIGSEDVRAASVTMRQAAHEMQSAAAQIEDSLSRHRQFLDDWLLRLEAAMTPERTS